MHSVLNKHQNMYVHVFRHIHYTYILFIYYEKEILYAKKARFNGGHFWPFRAPYNWILLGPSLDPLGPPHPMEPPHWFRWGLT